MEQHDLYMATELLQKEMDRLNTRYNELLEHDAKFPELKEIRVKLKQLQADLNSLRQKTS